MGDAWLLHVPDSLPIFTPSRSSFPFCSLALCSAKESIRHAGLLPSFGAGSSWSLGSLAALGCDTTATAVVASTALEGPEPRSSACEHVSIPRHGKDCQSRAWLSAIVRLAEHEKMAGPAEWAREGSTSSGTYLIACSFHPRALVLTWRYAPCAKPCCLDVKAGQVVSARSHIPVRLQLLLRLDHTAQISALSQGYAVCILAKAGTRHSPVSFSCSCFARRARCTASESMRLGGLLMRPPNLSMSPFMAKRTGIWCYPGGRAVARPCTHGKATICRPLPCICIAADSCCQWLDRASPGEEDRGIGGLVRPLAGL